MRRKYDRSAPSGGGGPAGLMGREWMKRSLRCVVTAAAWAVLGGILLLTVALPLVVFFFWPD